MPLGVEKAGGARAPVNRQPLSTRFFPSEPYNSNPSFFVCPPPAARRPPPAARCPLPGVERIAAMRSLGLLSTALVLP